MATPTLSTDKAGDPVGHGGHGMGTGNMEEPVTNLEELKARWASKEGGSAQFHQPLLNPLPESHRLVRSLAGPRLPSPGFCASRG